MRLIHGGNIYEENIERLREQGVEILDFSANVNPLGMPGGVREAVTKALRGAEHYPDPQCGRLKDALAREHGLPREFFICGNGGADLIYRLVYALCPKKALLTAPTFSEYEEALKQTGTEISFYHMGEELQVEYDILEYMEESPDIMFLCNPNNPTGLLIPQDLLLKIFEKAASRGILLAVDECFLDFTGRKERSLVPYAAQTPHLFILKSFTKLYAMPGIRLGYGICRDGELLARMEASGQCWGVSVLAQEAGIAALKETEYREQSIELIEKERIFLKTELESMGLRVWDGEADYLFFCAPGILDLYERLLPLGIIIRRCGNYRGLDKSFYRAAVKRHEENIRFIGALKRVLA